ncbi:hypothetical protein BDQ12DRAFT_677641 [Crucibulum laeve]|uniref:C2H2-type domain-containing protein n=1 Tax=Crucibulum laeve TaxID=68775 RepID=A0A5C3MB28_9AGAR|nr:hypothetical protein BDQ12DRAFT_677641 [Crucibulum laeve]
MAYCERCDRFFSNQRALWQHKDNSGNHNRCEDCNFDSHTWVGLKRHWIKSSRHSYCERCNEHYSSDAELYDHYDEKHDYCRKCNRLFVNQYGLDEHYRQSPTHHYCAPCKRHFSSESNLQSHMNSSAHKQKSVMCWKGCGLGFVSNSAMILHMESGNCRSGMNRATVNEVVRQYDRNNDITNPSRMLTGASSNEVITYYAGNKAWNGYGYECYLCQGTYRTLVILNQHLASSRHQDKIYFCPPRLSTCRQKFTTLSALCQHIESEKCSVYRFKVVGDVMDGMMNKMRMLTVN